jgi:predicted nucleotidyltransferase
MDDAERARLHESLRRSIAQAAQGPNVGSMLSSSILGMAPSLSSRLHVDATNLTALCRSNRVSRLWIFGSALRPDFRPDSDVDILVEFEPDARIGLLALARLQRELSRLFARPVDLVPLRGLKAAVRDEVLTQRELLYAA